MRTIICVENTQPCPFGRSLFPLQLQKKYFDFEKLNQNSPIFLFWFQSCLLKPIADMTNKQKIIITNLTFQLWNMKLHNLKHMTTINHKANYAVIYFYTQLLLVYHY